MKKLIRRFAYWILKITDDVSYIKVYTKEIVNLAEQIKDESITGDYLKYEFVGKKVKAKFPEVRRRKINLIIEQCLDELE